MKDNQDTVSNDRLAGVGRNSARGAAEWDLSSRIGWGFGFGRPPELSASQIRTIRISSRDDALAGIPSMGGVDKRYKVEFYVQAYNIFNQVNLTNFSGVETSPFFGRATAALSGRRIESGIRFSF